MTEAERKKIINEINREIEEKESLTEKYEQLEELTKNPVVNEYLQLLENINIIENNINRYKNPITGILEDSLEKRIERNFNFARSSCSCEHKVWFYVGSFYEYRYYKYWYKDEDYYTRYNDENLIILNHDFAYNKYICLECGNIVKIKKEKIKYFEKTNLILKTEKDFKNINIESDIAKYRDLYYQLLYNNYDFTDAQNSIIEKFNEDHKPKTRTLSNKIKK